MVKENCFEKWSLSRIVFWTMIVSLIIYLIYLASAVYVERALYADGANFFVNLLMKVQAWPISDDAQHMRLLVNVINQVPVSAALWLGVEDIRWLSRLFSGGVFFGPIFVYFFCAILSNRAGDYRVLFCSMASLLTCAMPSDIFIINQAFMALALSWVLMHYLLLNLDIKWFDWCIIAVVSIVLFRAHESLALWGGTALLGSGLYLYFRDDWCVSKKNIHRYTIGLLGAAHSSFVLFWQASNPVGHQTSAFLDLVNLAAPRELLQGNTRISILVVMALVSVYVYAFVKRYISLSRRAEAIAVACFCLFIVYVLYFGAYSLYNFKETNPFREYEYRFLISFGSVWWMVLSVVLCVWNISMERHVRQFSVIILAFGFMSASLWQISNNLQWRQFMVASAHVLESDLGPFLNPSLVKTKLESESRGYAYKYRWGWAWPVFGMSIQNNGEVLKLFAPEIFAEVFLPPRKLPFVPMSGVETDAYGWGVFSFERYGAK